MEPPYRQGRRRISKACETCRVKRTKCSGGVPCEQCTAASLGTTCHVRAKARSRRIGDGDIPTRPAPPSLPAPPAHAQRAGRFIHDIELTVDTWLENNGHAARLALPPTPRIATLRRAPLPSNLDELAALEDRLIVASCASEVQYMEFLTPGRINDLYLRHRSRPETLSSDQRAVVAACLCLGRLTELAFEEHPDGGKRMRHVPPDSVREDVTYYHLALGFLNHHGSVSCAALCALHCLALFAMLVGGPEDVRELLGAMSWQARELGLHRRETAAAYPAFDHVGPLFISTLYKDTWYSTLCDMLPFSRWGGCDVDMSAGPDVATPNSQGILWRLAMLENDLLSTIHSGHVDATSANFVLDTEARWWPLMRESHDEHGDRGLAAMHPYADIRYNWLRLMLRAPCMGHPRLGPSSTPMVARSVSRILHAYGGINAKGRYFPCWAQLRRIVTCGQLLVLCHIDRELGRAESELLLATFLSLLEEHVATFPLVAKLKAEFESVAGMLGLAIPDTPGLPAYMVEQLPNFTFDYDYSALSWFDPVDALPGMLNPDALMDPGLSNGLSNLIDPLGLSSVQGVQGLDLL